MKKELRLQRMPIVLAAIYVIVRLLVGASVDTTEDAGTVTMILSLVYAGALAVLIGSLASAEERQLATVEWQVMLPMTAWKQGRVKAATAVALALVLAIGVPVLVFSMSPVLYNSRLGGAWMFMRPEVFGTVVILTTGSLYVSSLCTNGVWALMLSLVAIYAADLFASFVAWPLFYAGGPGAVSALRGLRDALGETLGRQASGYVVTAAIGLVVIAICGVVVRLAVANHRYADRRGGRLSLQLAALTGCVAAWVFASGLFLMLR